MMRSLNDINIKAAFCGLKVAYTDSCRPNASSVYIICPSSFPLEQLSLFDSNICTGDPGDECQCEHILSLLENKVVCAMYARCNGT